MFTAECLIAALMLTAPSDAPQRSEWAAVIRPSVLALALADEVLDPREKGFVMGQDLMGDLTMLQGRHREFANAPQLDESERFPDRKLVNEFLAFNRAQRAYLILRRGIDLIHSEEISALIEANDRAYQVWDCVRDTRCVYYYVTVRRQSLSLLRDLLGAEAFYSGRMPPHFVMPSKD
jgi:hypothetical protein